MEVTWVLGLILGGIEYGALVALGVCCLVAFLHSPQTDGGWFNRKNVLSAHVLLVLLLNTFLQIWNTESNIKAIFYTKPDRLTFFYHDWTNLVNGFLATSTEGVLVSICIPCYLDSLEFEAHIGLAMLYGSESFVHRAINKSLATCLLDLSSFLVDHWDMCVS